MARKWNRITDEGEGKISPVFPVQGFSKKALIKRYFIKMVNLCLSMFEWKGLPDSLPQKRLEMLLQRDGYAIALIGKAKTGKYPEGLFATFGGVYELDPYYIPSKGNVANPYLESKSNVIFDEDAVLMYNDSCHEGLSAIHAEYATLLAENAISLRYALVNARVPAVPYADNDNTAKSIKDFFKMVFDGGNDKEDELLCPVTGQGAVFKGLKNEAFNASTNSNIKDLLEARQFLWASWFIEIGVQANFNMKREAINESEAGMNMFSLTPYIDDMLQCREQACEKINKLFNLNVSVELSSVWKKISEMVANMPTKPNEEDVPHETPKENEVKDDDENQGS